MLPFLPGRLPLQIHPPKAAHTYPEPAVHICPVLPVLFFLPGRLPLQIYPRKAAHTYPELMRCPESAMLPDDSAP